MFWPQLTVFIKSGKRTKSTKVDRSSSFLCSFLCDLITVRSLGLAVAPRVRFLIKAQQQKSEAAQDDSGTAEHEPEDELESFKAKLKGRQPESQSSQSEEEDDEEEEGDDDDDDDEEKETLKPAGLLCGFNEEDDDNLDLLTVKRKDVFNISEESEDDEVNKQHASGVITVIPHF